MSKFAVTASQKLDLVILEENNIKPKKDFPYIWKVGNKNLCLTDIEHLYNMAKLRAEEFEKRIEDM